MATGTVSRRTALRRGAAAGAVIWAAPMVASSTAHASNGSKGSKTDGKLESITCVWDQRYFQPRHGTPGRVSHDYSQDTFCDINVGDGWRTIGWQDQFTISLGNVLQIRPWQGHGGGSSAEIDPAPEQAPDEDESDEDTVTTTSAPAPADEPAPETTTATTAPEATTATTVAPAPKPVEAAPTTAAPAPAAVPTPTTAPVEVAPPADPNDYVDTIVIDMSGRTEINIGDVYGYFTIVDAEPA